MKSLFLITALVALLCIGCRAPNTEPELPASDSLFDARYKGQQQIVMSQLKKLQSSMPERDLKINWHNRDFRFRGVMGVGTEVFGVQNGITNSVVQKYGINRIQGTGDVVFSLEQAKLQSLAKRYSTRYNRLLMRRLQAERP